MSAQKDVSHFRSRSFSCKDVCVKSIICCEISLGIDPKLRRRTCTPTLALKNLIAREIVLIHCDLKHLQRLRKAVFVVQTVIFFEHKDLKLQ